MTAIGAFLIRIAFPAWVAAGACAHAHASDPARPFAAPPIIFEQEPNDTPEDATEFSGQAYLRGEVSGGDQDAWMWVVIDEDTDHLWDVELRGETSGLIRADIIALRHHDEETVQEGRVAPEDAGGIAGADTLLSLETRDGRPVARRSGVLVAPGEYLIGVSQAGGGGDYEVRLVKGERAPLTARHRDFDEEERPAIASERSLHLVHEESEREIRLRTGETDADAVWRVRVDGAMGARVRASVVSEDGEEIAAPRDGSPLQADWRRLSADGDMIVRLEHVRGEPLGAVLVRFDSDGHVTEGEEHEPNDRIEQANWADLSDGFRGVISGRGDTDFVAFTLDEEAGEAAWTLTVETDGAEPLQACLHDFSGRDPVCRAGPGGPLFAGVSLQPGSYALALGQRGREDLAYTVSKAPAPEPGATDAIEPNDVRDWAAPMSPNRPVRGAMEGDRHAWFELIVTGEPQLWRIQANGEGLTSLDIYEDGLSSALQTARGSSAEMLRLDSLLLMPGRHLIALRGDDAEYMLRAIPVGRPSPNYEQEPNDDDTRATPLILGERMEGTFQSARDVDYFHFTVPGWASGEIMLDPPADAAPRLELSWRGVSMLTAEEISERAAWRLTLPPGDYLARLTASDATELEYGLSVTLGPLWDGQGGEAERIGRYPRTATPMPASGRHPLIYNRFERDRWKALPVSEEDREITVHVEDMPDPRFFSFTLLNDRLEDVSPEPDDEDRLTVVVPAGEAWLIHVLLPGYNISSIMRGLDVVLVADDPALAPAAEGLTLELASQTSEAAAWIPDAQRIAFSLEASNSGDEDADIPVQLAASHHGVRFEPAAPRLEIAPGETASVEAEAILPPWLDDAVDLQIWARAGDAQAALSLPLTESDPVSPERAAGLDPELAGLPDLAWSGLGARWIDPETGDAAPSSVRGVYQDIEFLTDGLTATDGGNGFVWSAALGEPTPALALAGGPAEVRAVVFHQQTFLSPETLWRDVQLEYSVDGDSFEPLLTARLDVAEGDQVFRPDAPVSATHLRLRPLTDWGRAQRMDDEHPSRSGGGTGNWRVLGVPEDPSEDLARPDILRMERGGHVVSVTGPQDPGRWMLARDKDDHLAPSQRRREIDAVLGFLNHRKAALAELRWIDSEEASQTPDEDEPDPRVSRVAVMTAEESPAGPWTDHGVWELDRNEGGPEHVFAFDIPVMARYVRLVMAVDGADQWLMPAGIEAYEAGSLADGESVLGHWGHYSDHGPNEPAPSDAPEGAADTVSNPDAPAALDGPVRGRLDGVGDARSYTVEVSEGDNTLILGLEESAPERVEVALTGPDGEASPIAWSRTGAMSRTGVASGLEPGVHRIDVIEPVRSIVVAWDPSGSVADHEPAIFRAIADFSDGLREGEEEANFIPYGGRPLIDGWAVHPLQAAAAIGAHQRLTSADMARSGYSLTQQSTLSDSETGLLDAARLLEGRSGERAVFQITDAELVTPHVEDLWPALVEVRPRVFSIGVSAMDQTDTAKLLHEQQMLQAWSRVRGGAYSYSTTRGDMIAAFRRGMAELRRPTDFTLEAASEWRDPPEPGLLSVISGEEGPATGGAAVHMIFDASGSMLRRMEGGRRIDVARAIARETLQTRIPADVPVALRAFGHTEPGSCETELLAPAETGNREAVIAAVEGIEAINLSRTPLAASLAEVPGDLAAFEGGRQLVVMLTDGEETCEGDVEAVMAELIGQGVEIRVNIVGFHIDEEEWRRQFRALAAMSGGEYFNSQDGEELQAGLSAALAATWRAIGPDGMEAASGRVDGDPVELDAGRYTLVIEAAGGEERREIVIDPDTELKVEA